MNLSDTDQAPYSAPVNTGGAAFPQFEVVAGERDGHGDAIDAYTVAKGGMTLRDYVAVKVLPIILNELYAMARREQRPIKRLYDAAVLSSFEISDTFIVAREVRK